MTFLQVTGLQVGMIFLLETCHLAGIWEAVGNLDHQLVVGTWEAGLTMKNQVAVGNGLQAGMIVLQVTGLQVGMIFLLETFHLAGIWEVVGTLDLDHQLADKEEK